MMYALAALALVAAILGGLWQHERASHAADLLTWQRQATEMVAKREQAERAAAEANDAATAALLKAALNTARETASIKARIEHADDGPVAGALRAAIDGLRAPAGTDGGGKPAPSRSPSDVRSPAPGT